MQKVIIAIVGQDRSGIIAAVSKVLFEQNCNIENVSQSTLQYIFAGIFIVSPQKDLSVESLHRSLNAEMAPLGLEVHITSLELAAVPALSSADEAYIITTKGPDRKGLVASITAIIARYDVNVTNLQAVFKGGDDPDSNIMIYEVDVPADIDQESLYKDLRKTAAELSLDISIQHRNIFEAINRI